MGYLTWILSFAFLALTNAEMEGMFSIPDGCSDNDCTYKITWKSMPGSMVDFSVLARVDVGIWAGVGFSRNGRMIGSDGIVGWMAPGGMAMLTDRFLFAKSPDRVPLDASQDAMLKSMSHANGMLKYSFTRKIDTGELGVDIPLSEELFIIYAWGGQGSSDGSGRITVHTAQGNIGRTVMFDDIPSVPVAPPTTQMTVAPTQAPVESGTMDNGMEREPADKDMKEEPDVGSRSLGGSREVPMSCDMKVCPQNSECRLEGVVARCFCKPEYPQDQFGNCVGGSKPTPPPTPKPDKCMGVRCQRYAVCMDGNCRCIPNYEIQGDGSCKAKASETKGKCSGVKCPKYSMCKDGKCECMKGYSRQSDGSCKAKMSVAMDKCARVMCKAKYSMCKDGKCECMKGYSSHSDGSCKAKMSVAMDKCARVICKAKYSMCKDGKCECMKGYSRHSDGSCKAVFSSRTCGSMTCYENAECRMGKCRCRMGYVQHSGKCVKLSKIRCTRMNCAPGHCVVYNGRARCAFSRPMPIRRGYQGCKNRCGSYDYHRRCHCSHHCWTRGKCCPDFKQHCEQYFHLFRRPE